MASFELFALVFHSWKKKSSCEILDSSLELIALIVSGVSLALWLSIEISPTSWLSNSNKRSLSPGLCSAPPLLMVLRSLLILLRITMNSEFLNFPFQMRAYSLRWKQGSRIAQQFRNFRSPRLLIPYHKQIHDSHCRTVLSFVTNWHLFPITRVCSSEHLHTVRFSVVIWPQFLFREDKIKVISVCEALNGSPHTWETHGSSDSSDWKPLPCPPILPLSPGCSAHQPDSTSLLCAENLQFHWLFKKIVRKHCQISPSHKFTTHIPTEPLCDYVGICLPLSILYTFIWFLYIPLSTSPQPTWPPSRIFLVKPNATELKN